MFGLVQDCKRHKPDGCFKEGESKLQCPFCLIFPIMTLLHKITNHLELIKGARSSACHLAFRSAYALSRIYGKPMIQQLRTATKCNAQATLRQRLRAD